MKTIRMLAVSKDSFTIALNLQSGGEFPAGEWEYLEDFRRPEKGLHHRKFDIVFSYHDLAKPMIDEVPVLLKRWKHCLKAKGELHLFIPSVEWIAEQIIDREGSPVWKRALFGKQRNENEIYLSGFTLEEWRALLDRAGMGVIAAATGEYEMAGDDGEYYPVFHHYLVATKGRNTDVKKI